MSENTKRTVIQEMLQANSETSSAPLLKTKNMKTLLKTLTGNWKDQHLLHCRVSHHCQPRRAQNAGGDSTPKAAGDLSRLNSNSVDS